MSWVPTTDTGTFNTYLPPLGAPWATQYYMQGFAAGSGEVNGTAITGTTTTYTLTLPLAPGVLRAPLYMYSNAQASSLAANISGSSSPPYVFSNMQVDVNFTFNHFNDYTYPTFDLVNVQGVTQPVTIDNVTQGNDSATGTYYFYVYSSVPGLLSGPGEILPFSLPNYTAAINIYGGSQDKVTNEVMTGIIITFGFPAMGGSVFLWGDTGASVTNVVAQESSPGVYVGHCALTTVSQLTAQFFATGVTDVANSQMVGTGITVIDSVGVYAYGTTGSTYSYVNLTEGGRGFIVGGDFGDPYYDLPGTVGLTINHLNVTNGGIGANLTFATHTTVNVLGTYDTGGLYGSGGAWLDGTFGTTFTTVSAYGGEAWGIDMWNATYTNITGYVLTNSADLASIWDYSSNTAVVGMTMFNYSAGVISGIYGGHLVDTSFSNVAITEFDVGVDLLDPTSTSFTTVSISASVGGPGIALVASQYSTFSQVSTSGATVGVVIDGGQYSTLTASTVSDHSVGVFLLDDEYSTVTGVTALDAASSSPWSAPPLGLPALSAVLEIGGAFNTVSNVQATNYPAAYYSLGSIEPAVSNVNATGGMFALVLNGTGTGLFTNIDAYQDFVGIEINAGATHNVITMSSFVDSTSYGVLINNGGLNTIYDNSFIGNNGAGSSYSPSHIQASAGVAGPNYFDGSVTIGVDLGNYWSDWHTYDASGHLAPYPLAGGTFDHYPIGAPEGTVAVYFDETGLPSGVSWSATLNGIQESTTNSWLVFNVLPGSYPFSVGTVTGYSETPATGNVTASGVSVNEYLTYTAQYVVSVSETGLSSAALASGWSVTVGGVMASSTTVPYLNFTVGPGTYAYQVAPVAGYTASPSSGYLTVVNGAYQLLVTFTQLTYSVTITESGLANGASWSATVNGNAIPSTGSTITFTLPSGPYTVQVSNVSGYTLSSASLEVTVNGAPTGASVTYTPTSSPSYVKTGDFNNWLAVLLAVAVIALVVGLLALMLRRRKEPPAQSAQAWSPPPPSGSGGTPPPSGGAPGWSEGPPPGGST
jgi:LPXTG-motif cell wall-anchored protein